MAPKNTKEAGLKSVSGLREEFLTYFEGLGHRRVASSSLIPGNDPTILFTNAGMNQFKDVFLGLEKREYVRATTAQKCLRAGGKHNDLENVGFTARHHTFFEMLGNFSFGDYFKKDAIAYAYEFIFKRLSVPLDRVVMTVHTTDDDAADLWHKGQGIAKNRIFRFDKDNFWQMADTGPCGPCTEIHFDRFPERGPPTQDTLEKNTDERFLEFWNLVFMQYEQRADGTRIALPRPSVDTGMGLERMASILQGVPTNYDTDLFQSIMRAIETVTQKKYGTSNDTNAAFRVIADHLRSCTFLIADGVVPSNEGRGYVLRRILRRALRFGKLLGMQRPFLHELVNPLATVMGEAYPELKRGSDISRIIHLEEERFLVTLENGLALLEEKLAEMKKKSVQKLPGDFAFRLYDTYGFPLDLTQLICRERGLTVDEAAFEQHLTKQKEQSRSGRTGLSATTALQETIRRHPDLLAAAQEFHGYDQTETRTSVTALLALDGESFRPVDVLRAPEEGVAFVSQTPFYAEGGGQVGDQGELLTESGARALITDCQKADATHHAHFIHWPEGARGDIKRGSKVTLKVNTASREATAHNHSATHLLHAALRQVLGTHVKQSGSKVDPDGLRFDFSHFQGLTPEEIKKTEQLANTWAQQGAAVAVKEMAYTEALTSGALALFDEKYGDRVRTIKMGNESFELCGGTHVKNTRECYPIKIVSESSVAAGVRRIEAKAGASAKRWLTDVQKELQDWAKKFRTEPSRLKETLQLTKQKVNEQLKQLTQMKDQFLPAIVDTLQKETVKLGDVSVIISSVSALPPEEWRGLCDLLRQRVKPVVVVLFGEAQGKAHVLAAATAQDASVKNVHCGKLIQELASLVGGRGGGRPDMAQAGGSDTSRLHEMKPRALELLRKMLVTPA